MKKLILFPEPYPDEDIRSIFYRYHIRTSNSRFDESIFDLFMKKSMKNPMFPTRLDIFFRKLQFRDDEFNVECLLLNHTWYGLLRIFLNKEEHQAFIEASNYGSENPFGILSKFKHLFSKKLQYCPVCIEEDIKHYGEVYVHREHQFQFLNFCPTHFVKLIEKCGTCNELLCNRHGEELLRNLFCRNGHYLADKVEKVNLDNPIIQLKFDLFKIICSLSDMNDKVSYDLIRQKVLMMFWKKDFIHYKGIINFEGFLTSLIECYSKEALEAINLPYSYISHRSFLHRIFRESLKTNLLFYCLLIHFFFRSTVEMLNTNEPIANPIPFGHGPWKCRNKICECYNRNVINVCKKQLKNSNGVYVTGEFTCPFCGYIYCQRWHPKKKMKDKVMIKSMGHLWINKVLELYVEGFSTKKISEKLNSSEFAVRNNLLRIIGNAKKLNHDYEKNKVKECIQTYLETAAVTEDNSIKKTFDYKERILETISELQLNTRMEIINTLPKEYYWLKLYDVDWLEANIPPPIEGAKKAIDLSNFDKELSYKIKIVANELYNSYPYQIKKNTILQKLSKTERSRLSHQELSVRLPISMNVLEKKIEDINDYLIRALPRCIQVLNKKGHRTVSMDTLSSYYSNYKKCNIETTKRIEFHLKNNTLND